MNEWQHFLIQQGGQIQDSQINFAAVTDEAMALEQGNTLSPLLHLGVIKVSGADALDFMQNQFTNDLKLSTPELGQYNAYCSPKGRMLANFWLINAGEDFYLVLARELMEATLKRLRMYVLMSKVVLDDVSETMPVLGLAGTELASQFQQWDLPQPASPLQHVAKDEVHILGMPGPVEHCLILAPLTQAQSLFDNSTSQSVGNAAWRLLDIRSGIPMIYSQTTEAFVPQMANLQLINGVSFKKGCYPGQEIVARMQYLGSLKRRMYHARVHSQTLPEVGTSLFAAGSESGQGAGKVVDAQWASGGVVELLAVAEIKSAEGDRLQLGESGGAELELLDLPYPVEQAS